MNLRRPRPLVSNLHHPFSVKRQWRNVRAMSASLIGRLRSSAFRLNVLPSNNAFERTVKHRGPRLARHSGGGRPPKTRSLGNNMRMFLSRLLMVMKFIVPALYIAGAIVIWLDFSTSNHDGLANIWIAIYTFPIAINRHLSTARRVPICAWALL